MTMNSDEKLLDEGIVTIRMDSLLEYWDPIADNVWGCGLITDEEIRNYSGPLRYAPAKQNSAEFFDREFNIARIAYLLNNGWDAAEGDTEPVTLDVGLRGYTPAELIVDGNHRVAAAKLRGDETITVAIIGDVNKAIAVFVEGVYIDDY